MASPHREINLLALIAALISVTAAGSVQSRDGVELEVSVGNIVALPGSDSVEIPIYMVNHADSVPGFNVTLQLNRPDIMRFDTGAIKTGTLIESWPTAGAFSPSGQGTDIMVSAVAAFFPPYPLAVPPGSHPDTPLVKARAHIENVPDTLSDRTVVIYIITQPLNLFCFANMNVVAECIGYVDGQLDTTVVELTDGSLRVVVPYCGDADLSEQPPNVADLSFLVDYLFLEGAEPAFSELVDVDGFPGVNVGDLSVLVEYLFLEGPPPQCPGL